MSDFEPTPVESITIGAVGAPGSRMFLLQARSEGELVTLIIEKAQAVAIGRGCYDLLIHRGRVDMVRALIGEGGIIADDPGFAERMALVEDEPLWRVGDMALGFDEEKSLALVVCKEWAEDDDELEDLDSAEARFWLSEAQVAALGVHAMSVAAQGRPLCPICGLPLEEDGHVCPAANGHSPSFTEN